MNTAPVSRPSSEKKHIRSLTGLRFLAAIHVVLYHNASHLEIGWPSMPEQLTRLVHIGYSGVNLFFVLSGFILAYTYATPDGGMRTGLRRFWTARFARIYPLYLVSLALCAPLVADHFFSSNSARLASLKLLLSGSSALTLSQAWIPPLRSIWNAPSWSLSAEVYFYLAFPFLIGPIWRLSRKISFILLMVLFLVSFVPWLLSMALLPAEVHSVGATAPISNDSIAVFLRSSPVLRIHEFALGICLARLVLDPASSRVSSRLPAHPLAGLAIGSALVGIVTVADWIPRLLVHSGVLDLFYAFVIVFLIRSNGVFTRLLATRPFVLLGEASYGIYILHIPVRNLLLVAADPHGQRALGLGFLGFYLLVVIGVSLLGYRLVEEPARRYINALGRSSRGSVASIQPADPSQA